MKKLLVVLLVAVLMLVGCGEKKEVAAYLGAMDLLLGEWSDTFDRAASTSRIALSPVIGELQDIRREVDDLDVPGPCSLFHKNMVGAMNHSINGFIAFLGNESEEDVAAQFESGNMKLGWAMDNLADLREEYID